jgi:hypothetical protein
VQQTDRVDSFRRDRWLTPDRAGVVRRAALAFAVAAAITAGICTPVAIRAAEPDDSADSLELVDLPPTSVVSTARADPDPGP